MEDRTITTEMARRALQSFGENGQHVSNAQLYDALDLRSEKEKDRLRMRLADMVRSGEAIKVKAGVYTYNFKHVSREGRSCPAVWRFVRKSKPGWTLSECALMTRVNYTQVLRYCAWLEEEGFVERLGRNERNAAIYKATRKADAMPETPWPPRQRTDPFARERTAAAAITRMMLCADPYAVKTARDISEACRVLLARFEKPVTEDENGTTTEGEELC